MKKYLLTLLTALCLAALTACGQSAPEPEVPEATPVPTPVPTPMVMDVSLGAEWYTIDPTYINHADTASLAGHLFEGLTHYVPVENPQDSAVVGTALTLGLAESYSVSEDGLRYTFMLREDALWSDGQPVRAQDFVYSWRRLIAPKTELELPHAVSVQQLYAVLKNAGPVSRGELPVEALGITAEGDKVLHIDLEQPCPYFLKLCANISLVPLRQDVIEAHGGDWTNERNIVTCGPYTISSWIHDDRLTMVPNEYYYDAENLGPQELRWNFSDSGAAAVQELRSGVQDFITGIPGALLPELEAEGLASSRSHAGTYYLYINANAVGDWRVRAAMMLSIDREAITEAIGDGTSPAVGLIPAGVATTDGTEYVPAPTADQQPMYAWLQSQYPNDDLNTYEGRCSVARKLYNAALAAKSWYTSYQVYYRFNDSTVNRIVADTCAKNWQEVLGLRANFVEIDAAEYAESLRSGHFGVGYLQWLPDYNDPQSFLELMRRGGEYNYSGWADIRYNDLLDRIAVTGSAAERDALQLQSDAMLFTEGGFAVCPVYYLGESYGAGSTVHNVGHNAFGHYYFQYAHLDPDPVVTPSPVPSPEA